MKRLRKFTGLALCAALTFSLLAACGGKETDGGGTPKNMLEQVLADGVFIVATSPDFAPSEFVDSSKTGQDQYVGFDMTLARYIAQELGVELEIQAMSFDACQTAVGLGAVNAAISGFAPTETRAQNYEFSRPYRAAISEINQTLLVRKADYDKYTKPEDFAGVEVGAQNASLQYQLLTEQLPDAVPYTIGDLGMGVLELQSGNIDALAVAYGNGVQICDNNPDLSLCAWHFEYESAGTVILMPKGQTELAEAVSAALQKAEEAGKYPEWYAQALEDAKSASAIEVSIPDGETEQAGTGINFANIGRNIVKIWKAYWDKFLITGMAYTLALAAIAVIFGTIFGALIALMRMSRFKPFQWLAGAYTAVIRGTPMLLQIYFFYLFLPMVIPVLNKQKFICIAIALLGNSAAYVSEIIRSGIQAVDGGQTEAARSLGLDAKLTMTEIVLPQAVKNILPALGNEFIMLVKDTSLASTFFLGDLMTQMKLIQGIEYLNLEPLIILAIIYFILTSILNKLLGFLERRMRRGDIR